MKLKETKSKADFFILKRTIQLINCSQDLLRIKNQRYNKTVLLENLFCESFQ